MTLTFLYKGAHLDKARVHKYTRRLSYIRVFPRKYSESKMNGLAAKIKACNWDEYYTDLTNIRRTVFVEEQNVDERDEWDSSDPNHYHFMALIGSDAVGCGRLVRDGQIGRMAVLAKHRNLGIGGQLLRFMISFAKDKDINNIFLHAQKHAIPFYSRFGFKIEGEVFYEAGIPHQFMKLT